MSAEFDEIWALYADDGAQSLDAMETSLARLEAEPADADAVGSLFRAMHTFKGNSRILGLAAIEAVAHAAEDLVGLVRDDGIVLDRELSGLLLEATDVLRGMMEEALSARADAESARARALLDRMKAAHAARRDGTGPAPIAPDEPLPEQGGAEEESYSEAMIFGGAPASFADDPLYREIFFDLVRASLARIDEAAALPRVSEASTVIAAELAEIRDSALRIGFPNWPERADAAAAVVDDPDGFAALLQAMHEACAAEAGASSSLASTEPASKLPPETSAEPFCVPGEVLEALGALLEAEGARFTDDSLGMPLAIIDAWAQDAALPGIADACAAVRDANDGSHACAVFALGDGISRTDDADGAVRGMLEHWCAGRAADDLSEVARCLAQSDATDWIRVFTGMQMFAAACRHRCRGVSAEAAQIIAEVAGRMRDMDDAGPAAFVRLAAAFVEIARASWQMEDEASQVSCAGLERLLHETAAAARTAVDGAEIVSVPPGLPPELAKSLSRDNVAEIEEARIQGRYVHVVRADIGGDGPLGERFAAWLTGPGITSIASATIFVENRTLFDFLIATEHAAAALDKSLRGVDAEGMMIRRTATLGSDDAPGSEASRPGIDPAIALGLNETIGSFAVAHACIRQTLEDCIEADLPAAIDRIVGAHDDAGAVREKIGQLVGAWHQKLQDVMQAEVQAALELERLTDFAARSTSTAQAASVIDAMVVRVEGVQYVLPFHDIDQIITFPASRIVRVAAAGGAEMVGLQNGELARLLDLRSNGAQIETANPPTATGDDEARVQLVVTRCDGRAIAVMVDELVGQQTVHPRPLSGYLDGVRGVAGYAILKTGDIGMLLDVGTFAAAA